MPNRTKALYHLGGFLGLGGQPKREMFRQYRGGGTQAASKRPRAGKFGKGKELTMGAKKHFKGVTRGGRVKIVFQHHWGSEAILKHGVDTGVCCHGGKRTERDRAKKKNKLLRGKREESKLRVRTKTHCTSSARAHGAERIWKKATERKKGSWEKVPWGAK